MSSLATVNLLNTNSVKSGSTNVKKIKLGYMELWPENKQYDQHDWVENTAGAIIITNVKPRSRWIYEGKLKITDSSVLSGWYAFFGANISSSPNQFGGCVANIDGKIPELKYYYNSTVYNVRGNSNLKVGDVFEFKIDGYNRFLSIKINGTEFTKDFSSATIPDAEFNGDIGILGRTFNYNPETNPKPNKFYYLKITDGETSEIIHDFVPTHDLLNNEHGMMDTVTSIFYHNANSTGSLTCGDDTIYYDWIQNTSSAYINTGIKPKWEWRYELKVRITSSTVLSNYNTFMESLDGNGYLIGIYCSNGKNIYVRCEDNTVTPRIGQLNQGTANISAGYFMEYVIDPQNKYLKGVKKNSSGEVVESYDMTTGVIPQASGDMNNYNIHLFARSVNGTLNNQPVVNCKMYYFKIYAANTDTLVHNFVPCWKEGVNGMMDTVTNTFVKNANSSGTLTLGND